MRTVTKAAGMFRAGLLACGILAAPGHAQAVTDEAAIRFGARESVLDISLSPSGEKIAYIGAAKDHSEVLNIIDLAGDATVRTLFVNTEIITDLDWCRWSDDVHLVCQASGMAVRPDGVLIPFDRLFAIDTARGTSRELSRRQTGRALGVAQFGGDLLALDVAEKAGQVLVTAELVPEDSTGTRLASTEAGLGVDLVDVASGRRTPRERADPNAIRYIADQNGVVRVKKRARVDSTGNMTGGFDLLYRPASGGVFRPFAAMTIDGAAVDDFDPVGVDAKRDVVYAFVNKGGYSAIAEFPMDGTGAGKLLMSRSDVDVDRLIRIGRQRRVVGATYATEKREIVYFDRELASLARDLGKALPDQPLINIVGASADESKLLLIAASDTQPGMVYLYDKATRVLEPLLPMRDQLEKVVMGRMQPVSYPAADGTKIPAYLTLPPGSDGKGLKAIVMPHGGPGSRDEWGFDWLVQYFTAKGFAVLQPNFRGSAGYGEDWYGRNGFQAWPTAIGDVNDAGKWLVSEGIARADSLAIVGWSYGGYAALQSQVLDPSLYKAVVAIAPVTDLGFLVQDARDYTNTRLVRDFIGTGSHVEAGSPRRHAAQFVAPVALFHGTRDLNVDVRHSQAMSKALRDAGKNVSYHEFKDLQHDLGDGIARAQMLSEMGAFLAGALPAK